MKHKIVFFDMDGTLYQTENDVIQESALDAIQTLKDKGYIVCAATGRPLNQMKLILQRSSFQNFQFPSKRSRVGLAHPLNIGSFQNLFSHAILRYSIQHDLSILFC